MVVMGTVLTHAQAPIAWQATQAQAPQFSWILRPLPVTGSRTLGRFRGALGAISMSRWLEEGRVDSKSPKPPIAEHLR